LFGSISFQNEKYTDQHIIIVRPQRDVEEMRTNTIAGIFLSTALLGFVMLAVASAETQWLLMSRDGECVEIGSLKRKIPDLGDISDPYSFVKLMRQKGYEVSSNEISGANGKAVEVKVPERGLFLVFVVPEMCQQSGAR
jgi:hypothetical protein